MNIGATDAQPSGATVSISLSSTARYPRTEDVGESVYEMVCGSLRFLGVDEGAPGTAAWNPFGPLVRAGGRVHVLPNFVAERRDYEQSEEAFFAKVTHASVLHPILDLALRAVGPSGVVSVGNAPLQAARFERVCRDVGLEELLRAEFATAGRRIEVADLRGLKTEWNAAGALKSREETSESLVPVDIGHDSLLDELYDPERAEPKFRVGDYAAGDTESFHRHGSHVYLVNRRVLDAQLLISVPKLKTHEKVGITCAIKGTVGSIGRKECLAHHRRGGPSAHGDEYPVDSPVHRMMSNMLESAATQPMTFIGNAHRILSKTFFRTLRLINPGSVGGAWSGNDTAWRMALDIARILRYARPDGSLATTPQRRHIAIVDGIISGEGNGPLRASARHTGAIVSGTDICAVDWACALLMGMSPNRIPLLREAFANIALPLTSIESRDIRYLLNGESIEVDELSRVVSPPHVMPAGWQRYQA